MVYHILFNIRYLYMGITFNTRNSYVIFLKLIFENIINIKFEIT